MRKRTVLLCLVVVFLLLSSQILFAGGEYRDPDVLVFARTADERASVMAQRYEPLVLYLEEVTGKSINYYLTTSYAAVVEALEAGFIDIVSIAPTAYTLAKERVPDLMPLATRFGVPIEEHGVPGGPGYTAVLITKRGSEFDTIESLEGGVVGFADPASTSSYLVPHVVFTREILDGAPLDSFFGEQVFVGSHDAVIFGVLEGRLDGGFIFDAAPYRLYQSGQIPEPLEVLNILWISDHVPRDPYCVRGDLHPDLINKIREGLLTFHERPESEDYFRLLASLYFVEMTDEDYDLIRDLRAAMGD